MTDTDETTAFFAMAIGGASEMATQAQRHGGLVERVAAAHSLRIMLVVLIVPLAFNLLQVHGLDPYVPLARRFDPVGFVVLVAVTLGAAAAMERFGSPNSWMIGPLLAAAVITATGHTFSSLPAAVVNAGQLLIGISLGTHFTPEFFRAAPRYLAAVACITIAYLASALAFGLVLAHGCGTALVDRGDRYDAGRDRRDGIDGTGAAAGCAGGHGVSRDSDGGGGPYGRDRVCRVAETDGEVRTWSLSCAP